MAFAAAAGTSLGIETASIAFAASSSAPLAEEPVFVGESAIFSGALELGVAADWVVSADAESDPGLGGESLTSFSLAGRSSATNWYVLDRPRYLFDWDSRSVTDAVFSRH
jgi:hypothetical protein